MAKHVVLSTEGMEVSREEAGAVFSVKDDKAGVIGDLTVSTGGLRWRSKYQRESELIRWEELDELVKARLK
jgi:hypothetical protein